MFSGSKHATVRRGSETLRRAVVGTFSILKSELRNSTTGKRHDSPGTGISARATSGLDHSHERGVDLADFKVAVLR
jgi:hypothetical protein